MFNSYDKERFKKGAEHYTYYMELTNRCNALKNYTGIMKVKVISHEKGKYGWNTRFEILESKKLGSTISHNIHHYMGGYGSASCNFFNTYEECAVAHDNDIKEYAKGQNTLDRAVMHKKIITGGVPDRPKIEVDSVSWYNNLPKKEKKYVSWIKEYYEEI